MSNAIFDRLANGLKSRGIIAQHVETGKTVNASPSNVDGDIITKYAHKVNADVGYRFDMQLLDASSVGKNAAAVLFGFDPSLGSLTKADVVSYFDRHFNSTPVEVLAETANYYPKSNAVSVIVKRIVPTRPIDDSTGMKKITASTFLDTAIGEIWEVNERDGQQFLAKVVDEDIAKSALNRIQKINNPVRATLASVRVEASLDINKGDVVRFYVDGNDLKGTVQKVSGNSATIKADNKTYTVPLNAVFYRSEMGDASRREMGADAYEYYKEVYGPDYAKELTAV